MRIKYRPIAAAPRAEFWEDESVAVGTTVYEAESSPRPTGVYDAHGVMIYRTSERDPIGFRTR